MMSMANIMDMIDKKEDSKKLYYMILRCIRLGYIEGTSKIETEITIMSPLANTWTRMGNHDEAIGLYKKALDMSRENDYARRYTVIFGEMAWSMLREIEKGKREDKDKKKAEQYLRQAYYIAAARREEKLMKETEDIYEEVFRKKIY